MGLKRLESSSASAEAVRELGLDPTFVELTSVEGLAASIRRAASFMCPTTPGALVGAVAETLSGLTSLRADESRPQVEALLDALISYGDLLELPLDDAGGRRRHLFLGPPAYVRRARSCVLVGLRSEGAPTVSGELGERVEYCGHVRLIRSDESVPVNELLAAEGLDELRPEHWLQSPRECTPDELVATHLARLGAATRSGAIDGLRLMDPASDATFYRGRWRALDPVDGGRFVGRRPQAFGANLWCFVEVVGGEVTRLIDLPIESSLARGCDEAWRLQAALDALTGHPQVVRVRPASEPGSAFLDLFSPTPSWSQRRLDLVGAPAPRFRGALASYELRQDDVEEELQFLQGMMWCSVDRVAEGTPDD